MQHKKALFLLYSISIFACDHETPADIPQAPKNSLQAYTVEFDSPWVPDSVIACAAGGQVGFLESPSLPISVFFYPLSGAEEFRYYESPDADIDPDDLSKYQRQSLAGEPLFNGYLHRFTRPPVTEDVWGRVSFELGGRLYICLLYTSPSPRDRTTSRMPSSA